VVLTSAHNHRLQEMRKAVRAGRPTPDGFIVAEGPHLLQEAFASSWQIAEIFCTSGAFSRFSGLVVRSAARTTEVSDRAFDALASTENSQGIATLLRPRSWNWDDLLTGTPLVVILDAIQDPGNVGTIIRSAEAFGATGIVLTSGSARVSNGKVLRAAAGSLFRMPFLEAVAAAEIGTWCSAASLSAYALAADGDIDVAQAAWQRPCCVFVGNEGSGVCPVLREQSIPVRIPTARVESLNAAVACSVALFAAASQRSQS